MNSAKELLQYRVTHLVSDPSKDKMRDTMGDTMGGAAKEPVRHTAAWWARNPHFQTTLGRLGRSRHLVTFRREILTTPDDDDLVLDHVDGPAGAPRVLLLHGLEGSSYSVYMQGLARLLARAGWQATALNFRSCARDPKHISRSLLNRQPRLYHSGETGDLGFVVRTLAAREPSGTLYAAGVSLGGNVLLKWLGEQGARSRIEAAVTISVPYDLRAAALHLERRSGRFYAGSFLKSLKGKALELRQRFPAVGERLDASRISAARTFFEFDDAATAPLHGFKNADAYYRRSSSLHFLDRIEVPVLCLGSADDPFLPAEVIEKARHRASDDVEIVTTPWGGHAGFIAGRWPWKPLYWAEERAIAWLTSRPI
jgi:predicted alpha/beta-fold hydrolase